MEEESTSWIRRVKYSDTMLPRSSSSREPSALFSIQPNNDPKPKIKVSGSNLNSVESPLPMQSSNGPNQSKKPGFDSSLHLKSSRPEMKNKNLISQLKQRGPTIDSSISSPDSGPKGRRPSCSKPKPNPKTTLASSDFSFYPDGDSGLIQKCSDHIITSADSLRTKTDEDSCKPSLSTNKNGRNSKVKRRSLSPLPTAILSDVFKEARSISKRFSTPPPSRRSPTSPPNGKQSDKYVFGKHKSTFPLPSEIRRLHQLPLTKSLEKLKVKKGTSWVRYFDNGVGRVTAVETIDEWMVDRSELYLGQRFACGAHSRLYHGFYKERPVAVKIIRQPDDDENREMAARLEKHFIREVTLLSHLHHRNVIKLAGALKERPLFLIVTEYLSGGSLQAFLHQLKHESLPLQTLTEIALDIARAMEYIHSQGVIHRDLKPQNIIFDEDFIVKIVDFGIACEEAYCDALTEDPGTYRWMAPEMIKSKPYGRKVDVYSFGLIIWEMVTGTVPYEDMTPIQAAFAVVDKDMRPVIPVDCPPALRALIELCWSLIPENRPEFWQIVKVLELFKASIARGETNNLLAGFDSQDPKKQLLHLIQKLEPSSRII